jgi:hypothetical protein
MWADYYAMVADGFKKAITETSGSHFAPATSDLLVRTSQESYVHLLWDYMNSTSWTEDILPKLQGPEEFVRELFGVLEALNWGKIRLCSLIPREELIIEIDAQDSSNSGQICHMIAGATAAVMDVLYGEGKSAEKRLFNFRCVETECKSKGAPACRFVVTPMKRYSTGQCIKLDLENMK